MPSMIAGLEFTLFADRDRTNLALLSYRGRVDWFELRFRRMLIEPLETLQPTNRGRHPDDLRTLMVFGTVLFNGVEALGSFCAALLATNRERFDAFVHGFMDPIYRPHGPALWGFRNALAHGLAVEQGAFEFFDGPAVKIETGIVTIDPDGLLLDFKFALDAYLQELRSTQTTSSLRLNFEERFDDRYKVPPCRT